MAIATTFSLYFLFNPIFQSDDYSVLVLITNVAYPILDLGFLFATVSLYYKSYSSLHKRVIFLILTGFVIQIVADSLHTYFLIMSTYQQADKSFVNDITTCSKDEAIIQTIVDMGHHLKINVVAEGIENEQQLRSLVKLQCNVGQGYFFSKPLPPDQVEQLFNRIFVE